MTKEEAKLVLDNARPQTKEIDRQFYDDEDLNNALDMAIKALEQQSIAEERYQDLVEYFDDKDVAKCILEDREEFKKWLERIKWHVRKADELAKKLEQQPSDCVSREQAVKAMTDWYFDMLEKGEGRDFINILDALPPVTPTQRWIPVSERLPEEDEDVLITYKRLEKRVVGMAYRQPNNWRFENDRWISNKLVVAWQPLPKAYEE